MRRSLFAALAVALTAALVPALALAKGASKATIAGPGLASPIRLGGSGEPGSGSQLGRIAENAGFFQAVFGQQPDPMRSNRPGRSLGPRYRITYVMPGPNGRPDRIRQDVYPFAKPTPVTYMPPGQRFFVTERTRGGWFVASKTLRKLLVAAGVPARSPA